MKRFLLLAVMPIIIFVGNAYAQHSKVDERSSGNRKIIYTELKFQVSSQCEMCKATIEGVLKKVKGVKRAVVNLSKSEATVYYDASQTDEKTIKSNVTAAGYDADEMQADPVAYEKLHSCCKKKSHQ